MVSTTPFTVCVTSWEQNECFSYITSISQLLSEYLYNVYIDEANVLEILRLCSYTVNAPIVRMLAVLVNVHTVLEFFKVTTILTHHMRSKFPGGCELPVFSIFHGRHGCVRCILVLCKGHCTLGLISDFILYKLIIN